MSDSGTYVWGGLTWKLLHGLASLGLKGEQLERFIAILGRALPCSDCRVNIVNHMATQTFGWHNGERAVYDLHVVVNESVHPGHVGPSFSVVQRRAQMVDRHFTTTDLVSLVHIIFTVCDVEKGSDYERAVCEFIGELSRLLIQYRPDLSKVARGLLFCRGCLPQKGGGECARYMLTLAPPLMVVLG